MCSVHDFKYWIFIFLFILFRRAYTGSLDLGGIWQFNLGDSIEWAQVEYSDENWDYIDVPQVWETAGFNCYNGYAWYRKTVVIPESWQTDKYLKIKKALFLDLGNIDDVDQTFFNAQPVGMTGSFPPDYRSCWNASRHYQIPIDLVRWGKKNVIAVRVYDREGNGGIYWGKPKIKTPSSVDFSKVEIRFNNPRHLYVEGESILGEAVISNDSFDILAPAIEWLVQSDVGRFVENLQQKIIVPMGLTQKTSVCFHYDQPGFYYVTTRLLQENEVIFETTNTIGYATEKLIPKASRLPDFNAFWKRTQQQLTLIPIQPKFEKIDTLSSVTRNYYNVQLLSFNNIVIHGSFILPNGVGPYPTILKLATEREYHPDEFLDAFQHYAIFILDVRGIGNSRTEVNPGFPGYLISHISNKEKYILRGAIMDCIRALEFLVLHPKVDTTRIAIVGEGLSGGLALATAGLNSHAKLIIADAPLMAGLDLVLKIISLSYYEILQYVIENPTEKEAIFQTLNYFDLVHFASKISCPVLLSIGLKDNFTPPRSVFLIYNQLSAPKDALIYPHLGHEYNQEECRKAKIEWIEMNFGFKQNDPVD